MHGLLCVGCNWLGGLHFVATRRKMISTYINKLQNVLETGNFFCTLINLHAHCLCCLKIRFSQVAIWIMIYPTLKNRKGLRVVVCIWEIRSLHNLELQLQHELAGLKTLWLLNYKYNGSWLPSRGVHSLSNRANAARTQRKAAKWTAPSSRLWLLAWHRWCCCTERLLIIIYLTFLHLSCWSVWSILTARKELSNNNFKLMHGSPLSPPQLPWWFLWSSHF